MNRPALYGAMAADVRARQAARARSGANRNRLATVPATGPIRTERLRISVRGPSGVPAIWTRPVRSVTAQGYAKRIMLDGARRPVCSANLLDAIESELDQIGHYYLLDDERERLRVWASRFAYWIPASVSGLPMTLGDRARIGAATSEGSA